MPAIEPVRPAVPLIGLLVAAVTLAGCADSPTDPSSGDPPEEITSLPRQLGVSERAVITAGNRFAFELARRVSAPDSGFFVSPLSASMALGMTMNGAAGDTRDQMRTALGFGDLTQEEINVAYRDLVDLLLGLDPSVETAIGNSVWYRDGFQVRSGFLDAVRDFFDAEVQALDFSDPGAAGRINRWVRDATRDRIERIVPDPVPGDVVMYLINAIYFKGAWTDRFDPERTTDAPFHRPDGSTVDVPLMQKRFEELRHHRGEDVQAVDLPYGGKAFSMTVLLPDPGVELEAWLSSLDAERWEEITGALDGAPGRPVQVFLPRFEMEYERTLNDDLRALGMTDAFDPGRADFSALTPGGGVWVDEVKQKAFVTVNEEGTEAAAATSVGVVESAPPTFRVDRPFLFVIRERLSGTILFLGKVVDPGS